jgi:hypothetical protein
MSSTPRCELNDDQDAAYIIGMVETGEQLFLCAEHAAHFGLTLALQVLDPAEIINAAQAIGARPADNGAEAPARKPGRKRAAKGPAQSTPERPEIPAVPEGPPAGDD